METLDWRPRYADIDTILAHALEWERKLQTRNWSVRLPLLRLAGAARSAQRRRRPS